MAMGRERWWRGGVIPSPESKLVEMHAELDGVDAACADEIDVAGESEKGGAA